MPKRLVYRLWQPPIEVDFLRWHLRRKEKKRKKILKENLERKILKNGKIKDSIVIIVIMTN